MDRIFSRMMASRSKITFIFAPLAIFLLYSLNYILYQKSLVQKRLITIKFKSNKKSIRDTSNIHLTQSTTSKVIPVANKIILLWTMFYYSKTWNLENTENVFDHCAYNKCILSVEKNDFNRSDALLMHFWNFLFEKLPATHPPDQIWIFYLLESPHFTCDTTLRSANCLLKSYNGIFNWTATYLSESDIPIPYIGYHKSSNNKSQWVEINYAAGKNKLATIFISNCFAVNFRLDYLEELRNLLNPLQLDRYGACYNETKCPSHDFGCEAELLKPYKFYLAFENSNCVEYVTEKVERALKHGLVPVVYGARYVDYLDKVPPASFIYISSPLNEAYVNSLPQDLQEGARAPIHHPYFNSSNFIDLAKYLKKLHADHKLYNNYHAWRRDYTAELGSGNENYLCQICRHLHVGDIAPQSYQISKWWLKEEACSP